jgi:phosphoribosylformylglycinamidine cyclo-ligase
LKGTPVARQQPKGWSSEDGGTMMDSTGMGMEDKKDDRIPDGGLTYRDAGVDIDAQDDALRRIKKLMRSARTAGVLSELGGFGGLYALDLEGVSSPVLVASSDGIGTKLRAAFLTGIHNTVGRDLVNHCVNDILVQGAKPLFFLDYIATGRLEPGVLAGIVEGITRGCKESGCALLGGETAEMPGFYADGEYDVAGFIVGMVDRSRLLDGSRVRIGDVLVGLPSAGLHTNGFSLARKVFFELAGLGIEDEAEGLDATVGEILLREHRCYLNQLAGALDPGLIHGLAHITGGGLTDNLPRVLPAGAAVEVRKGSWPQPPLFEYIRKIGRVREEEMYRTFNMGIGMVAIIGAGDVDAFEDHLDGLGEAHYRIGDVREGDGRVLYV